MKDQYSNLRPFVKWAGGKKQLLKEFDKRLPISISETKTIGRYIEPFVGGGAMFFYLKKNYQIKESILIDINRELVMAYHVIKKDPKKLVRILKEIEENHLDNDETARKKNYYSIRTSYNEYKDIDIYYSDKWIERTSNFIFLNKTCFNGLFRQNKSGEFNVPFGLYKNPKICDEDNIICASEALRDTEILCADFKESEKFVNDDSFVYFDPPYRPLSKTSNFTNYSKMGFNDFDQVDLSNLFKKLDQMGALVLLSNSDPKNEDSDDEFFDELYNNYVIERIPAKRNINRDASGRGVINELVVRNYQINL